MALSYARGEGGCRGFFSALEPLHPTFLRMVGCGKRPPRDRQGSSPHDLLIIFHPPRGHVRGGPVFGAWLVESSVGAWYTRTLEIKGRCLVLKVQKNGVFSVFGTFKERESEHFQNPSTLCTKYPCSLRMEAHLHPTRVPRSKGNACPQDPTVNLCLWSYNVQRN